MMFDISEYEKCLNDLDKNIEKLGFKYINDVYLNLVI